MLPIKIPKSRFFDETKEEFVEYEPVTLKLEHSLISIQKWESKWHKSYLSSNDITPEESLDYIRCMSLDPNVDPIVFRRLTKKNLEEIKDYIRNPMTATTFSGNTNDHGRHSIITAEIIYYAMIANEIPFECAKWHLNQLLTLIKVCNIKNNPTKMNKRDAGKQRSALNKLRRAKTGSSG